MLELNNKKQIVVICGAGIVSGKERIMLALLCGLKESGFNIFCITSSWCSIDFESLLSTNSIPYEKIRIGFISKSLSWRAIRMTLHQALYYPFLLLDYRKICRQFKPDIVIHTNFHHLFLLLPILSSKYSNIYHSHESILNNKFYKKLFLVFNKKINRFIGVSDFVSQRLIALGIPKKKVATIYNGISIRNLELNYGKYNIDIVHIGIVGQIGEWKGHEDLIEAVYILICKGIENIQLFIYGEGDDLFIDNCKRQIKAYNIDKIVSWMGYVKSINEIYNNLNIVCIPSRSEEPLATSALEPGTFSVPIVVTNCGGLPEIVENGINGIIVEAKNPIELANALEILVINKKLMSEMGKNHFKIVKDKFSNNQFINTWVRSLLLES